MHIFHKLAYHLSLRPQRAVEEIPPVLPLPSHEHSFQEKLRTYAAPRRDMAQIQQEIDYDTFAKALLGATTVWEECVMCSESRATSVLGSDRPQIDDLMDRAEQFGPQYVARNNQTFVLSRYQPAPAAGVPLPLR